MSLAACGGPPTVCGPFNAAFSINCPVATNDLALAQSMIVADGLATQDELDTLVPETDFYVSSDLNWAVGDVSPVEGMFQVIGVEFPQPEITLNRRGPALLHELLHGLQWLRKQDYTSHEGWDTDGRYAADDAFGSAYQPYGPLVLTQ